MSAESDAALAAAGLTDDLGADRRQPAPHSSGGKTAVVAAICCATRRRPHMLRALLESWQRLEFPAGVTPVFVVVENDAANFAAATVEHFRSGLQFGEAIYRLEAEIGIPYARNTAVAVALSRRAEIICFVDDDETVAPDWFLRLYTTYSQSNAQLVGGPVRAGHSRTAGSTYDRMIEAGIRRRYEVVERKARARLGRANATTTILTNNWMADAALFTEHGLCFDRSMRFSGGSDTKFFRDAVAKGIRTAWSPDAIVFETISPERRTLTYQFWRASEQSKNSIGAKIAATGRVRQLPRLLALMFGRLVGMIFLFLAIPFSGGRTLVPLARTAGWISGRIAGFLGHSSNLYRHQTGF